jgi:hypothetical protein
VWSDLLVAAAILASFGVGFFAGRFPLDVAPPPFTGDRQSWDHDEWWSDPADRDDCRWCGDHDTAPWGKHR